MVHTVVFVSLNALNSLFSLVLYTTMGDKHKKKKDYVVQVQEFCLAYSKHMMGMIYFAVYCVLMLTSLAHSLSSYQMLFLSQEPYVFGVISTGRQRGRPS